MKYDRTFKCLQNQFASLMKDVGGILRFEVPKMAAIDDNEDLAKYQKTQLIDMN